MRTALALAALFLVESLVLAQDRAAAATLEAFEKAKPSEKSLAFYSLDWVCSLAEAKARARKENRPVLVILNTNITAHCNFYSGHT